MKTNWDYSELAKSYLLRPNYAPSAISALLKIISCDKSMTVCDIGAGVAHLTLELAPFFKKISAVEPNPEMRSYGVKRTKQFTNVDWFEGTGEVTKQPSGQFDLCSFGSSFNVCDRAKALVEVKRISKPKGWFTCLWNHRDLTDPIQAQIEEIIKQNIEGFEYGKRREDQTSIINKSDLFGEIVRVQGDVVHEQKVEDVIGAWRSHASLQRQAGEKFSRIISDISDLFKSTELKTVKIPYTTRIWVAQLIE